MKKFLLGLIAVSAISMSASSCKNVVECCDEYDYCYTISRNSYPVPGTFKVAIQEAEADGYDCN